MTDDEIKRGYIYYADLGDKRGSVQKNIRPVLIIQNDIGNKYSPTVIVAPISSKAKKKRRMPTHIVVNVRCLPMRSVVLLEQITTISKSQLLNRTGIMPPQPMKRINKAIKASVALR